MELHSFQLGMVTGAVRRFITLCPVGDGGIFCGGRTVSARDARVITERVRSVDVASLGGEAVLLKSMILSRCRTGSYEVTWQVLQGLLGISLGESLAGKHTASRGVEGQQQLVRVEGCLGMACKA